GPGPRHHHGRDRARDRGPGPGGGGAEGCSVDGARRSARAGGDLALDRSGACHSRPRPPLHGALGSVPTVPLAGRVASLPPDADGVLAAVDVHRALHPPDSVPPRDEPGAAGTVRPAPGAPAGLGSVPAALPGSGTAGGAAPSLHRALL